jgi:hypothetical protein
MIKHHADQPSYFLGRLTLAAQGHQKASQLYGRGITGHRLVHSPRGLIG